MSTKDYISLETVERKEVEEVEAEEEEEEEGQGQGQGQEEEEEEEKEKGKGKGKGDDTSSLGSSLNWLYDLGKWDEYSLDLLASKRRRTHKEVYENLINALPYMSTAQKISIISTFISFLVNIAFIVTNFFTLNESGGHTIKIAEHIVIWFELIGITILALIALFAWLLGRNYAVCVDILYIMKSFSLFKCVQWCGVSSALDMANGLVDHHFSSTIKGLNKIEDRLQTSFYKLNKLQEGQNKDVYRLLQSKKLLLQIQWINLRIASKKRSNKTKFVEFLDKFHKGITVSLILSVILLLAALSVVAMFVKLSQVAFVMEERHSYQIKECFRLLSLWNQLGGLGDVSTVELKAMYYQLFANEQGKLRARQSRRAAALDGMIKELLIKRKDWKEAFWGFLIALSLNKTFLHQILYEPYFLGTEKNIAKVTSDHKLWEAIQKSDRLAETAEFYSRESMDEIMCSPKSYLELNSAYDPNPEKKYEYDLTIDVRQKLNTNETFLIFTWPHWMDVSSYIIKIHVIRRNKDPLKFDVIHTMDSGICDQTLKCASLEDCWGRCMKMPISDQNFECAKGLCVKNHVQPKSFYQCQQCGFRQCAYCAQACQAKFDLKTIHSKVCSESHSLEQHPWKDWKMYVQIIAKNAYAEKDVVHLTQYRFDQQHSKLSIIAAKESQINEHERLYRKNSLNNTNDIDHKKDCCDGCFKKKMCCIRRKGLAIYERKLVQIQYKVKGNKKSGTKMEDKVQVSGFSNLVPVQDIEPLSVNMYLDVRFISSSLKNFIRKVLVIVGFIVVLGTGILSIVGVFKGNNHILRDNNDTCPQGIWGLNVMQLSTMAITFICILFKIFWNKYKPTNNEPRINSSEPFTIKECCKLPEIIEVIGGLSAIIYASSFPLALVYWSALTSECKDYLSTHWYNKVIYYNLIMGIAGLIFLSIPFAAMIYEVLITLFEIVTIRDQRSDKYFGLDQTRYDKQKENETEDTHRQCCSWWDRLLQFLRFDAAEKTSYFRAIVVIGTAWVVLLIFSGGVSYGAIVDHVTLASERSFCRTIYIVNIIHCVFWIFWMSCLYGFVISNGKSGRMFNYLIWIAASLLIVEGTQFVFTIRLWRKNSCVNELKSTDTTLLAANYLQAILFALFVLMTFQFVFVLIFRYCKIIISSTKDCICCRSKKKDPLIDR